MEKFNLYWHWDENHPITLTFNELKNNLINDVVDIMFNNMGKTDEETRYRYGWAKDIQSIYNAKCLNDLQQFLNDNGHVVKPVFIISDEELNKLNEEKENGEYPYCDQIEYLINKHCTELDDNNEPTNRSTLKAMWDMQLSSQVHEWCGMENAIYVNIQLLLLDKLGLTLDECGEKVIRKIDC